MVKVRCFQFVKYIPAQLVHMEQSLPFADGVKLAGARLGRLLASLRHDVSGNAMVLIAGALLPLIALMGSAIDMGRSYLVQARMQSACDAGVLAARKAISANPNFVVANDSGPIAARGSAMFNANFPPGFQSAQNVRFVLTVNPDLAVAADVLP